MIPLKKSFKLKLITSYIVVVFISFGFIAYFLNKKLEDDSLRNIKSSLVNQAYLVENQVINFDLKSGSDEQIDILIKSLSQKISSRLTIINTEGVVLADSEKPLPEVLKMENHANRPEIAQALRGAVGEEIRYSSTLRMDMLYVATPITQNGRIIGAVRISLPLISVQRTLSTIHKAILLGLFFAMGLAFVIGSLLANGIIKPINKIIRASRKFSEGDFSHRIFSSSQDEIGELTITLNKMAQDIEDKIKAINTQHQHLRAMLDSMVEGVIVVDKNGGMVSINPTVEKLFGIQTQDIEGKGFLEAIRNNDIAEIIDSVLNNGKQISKELKLVFPVQKIFQINASPIFENSMVNGCVLVIHDTTEMHRLETVRRDFIANVSHELKTPLTSIKGFIETLLGGAIEDKQDSRSFLQIVQNHTERLAHLINDLLSLSYLESPFAKIIKEEVNLKNLTDEILSGMKAAVKKKNISISNELSNNISILVDKNKIEQVLVNLIDNAIKFNNERGSIRIYSQAIDNNIKVVIEDTGTGIPAKDTPRIFERFYRVDKARSRELGGTGLGLSIVKHIVELHGGTVGVESTEGLGSKLFFTLPK